jgi:hypothetical protein
MTACPRGIGYAERRFQVLAPLLFAALAGLAVLFAAWAADDEPPIENMVGRAISVDVRDDGAATVLVEWTGRRLRLCDGFSYRWIIDGYITQLASAVHPPEPASNIGKVMTWRVSIPVPPDLHDGAGAYRIRMTFACNPLQRIFPIIVDPPDVPFLIDRRADGIGLRRYVR